MIGQKKGTAFSGLRLRYMSFAAKAWPTLMNGYLGIKNNFVKLKVSDVGSYEEYLGSVE